jgi:hypothetical protein
MNFFGFTTIKTQLNVIMKTESFFARRWPSILADCLVVVQSMWLLGATLWAAIELAVYQHRNLDAGLVFLGTLFVVWVMYIQIKRVRYYHETIHDWQ